MEILLLSPFFAPEPISTGRYNSALAQCLAGRGEQVVAIASHPLYPKWRPEISTAQLPNILIKRGGAWVRYPSSPILRRLVLETWYALYSCIAVLRLGRRPDCVVSIFPPDLFILIISPFLVRDTRIVGIVHDLQGVLAVRSRSLVGRLLQSIVAGIERRAFARCSRLIFLSHSMAERAIRQYGLKAERCVVCYPFLTLPEDAPESTKTPTELMPGDFINVVYSGALGAKQCPDELLAFMSALARRSQRIRCYVYSAGPQFERLKAIYSRALDAAVSFHDLVPEDQLEDLYARSSVQVVPQASGTGDGAIPSKLPNLLAAGVPIFAICDVESEINRILVLSGAGGSAAGFSDPDLMKHFDRLLLAIENEPRERRIARCRSFVHENFSVGRVADAIVKS